MIEFPLQIYIFREREERKIIKNSTKFFKRLSKFFNDIYIYIYTQIDDYDLSRQNLTRNRCFRKWFEESGDVPRVL